jgi:hypothetical protein
MTASQLDRHCPFSRNFITMLHKGACMYSKIKTWTSACFMNILPGTFGSRSMILYSTCDLKITFRGIFFPEQNNSGKSSCKLLKHTEIRRQNYNQNHNHYHKLFSIKILRYIPTNSRKIFRWPSLLLLFHWSLSFRKVTECQLRIKICFNFYYIIR